MAQTVQMTKINIKSLMLYSILGLCLICHYVCSLNFHCEKKKFLHHEVMVMKKDIYIVHTPALYGTFMENFWVSNHDVCVWCIRNTRRGISAASVKSNRFFMESIWLISFTTAGRVSHRHGHSARLSINRAANLLGWVGTSMTTHRLHESPLSGFYQEQTLPSV